MKRRFTRCPTKSVTASARKKQDTYQTVGEIVRILSRFPADYPIRIVGQTGWGIDNNEDLCFIKSISDHDDACEIEII